MDSVLVWDDYLKLEFSVRQSAITIVCASNFELDHILDPQKVCILLGVMLNIRPPHMDGLVQTDACRSSLECSKRLHALYAAVNIVDHINMVDLCSLLARRWRVPDGS